MLFPILADPRNRESLTRTRVASAPEFRRSQRSALPGDCSSPWSCRSPAAKVPSGRSATASRVGCERGRLGGRSAEGAGVDQHSPPAQSGGSASHSRRRVLRGHNIGRCLVRSARGSSGWDSTSQGRHEVGRKTGGPGSDVDQSRGTLLWLRFFACNVTEQTPLDASSSAPRISD